MKNYTPGDAYANLKDEMASEFTVGLNPRLKEGTTTYDSGTVATTTETPYGYQLQMRGPKKAAQPPAVTPNEEFTDAIQPLLQITYGQDDDYLAAIQDMLKSSSGESLFYEMPDMAEEEEDGDETISRSERIEGL
tara:strand:- start:1507 stop:1911 length:405 start_codon:yes stop_codon:yes gene_type:complete